MVNIRPVRQFIPDSLRGKPEYLGFFALAGCVSIVLVSIAASQILLAVTLIGFVWVLKSHHGHVPPGMRILLPLIVFMIWILVAALAASDVILGLRAAKKFYLFLLVPVVPLLVRGSGRLQWIWKAIFAVAVISSLQGLVQFASDPNRDLLHRISGFMSQWMTYSGLLMLALVLAAAYAFQAGIRKNKWLIPVVALISIALILTLTRNSWMGAMAGILTLILLKRPRSILILLAAILAIYSFSPEVVRQRIRSIGDTTDPRAHVFMAALHLIQDNPWVGVGPKNVNVEALKYRDFSKFPDWLKKSVELFSTASRYQEEEKEFPDWLYQHMHNNPLQIAAETGIPGLLIWFWLMGQLAWDAWKRYQYARRSNFNGNENYRQEALVASTAALAAWVALMVAGLFEYNFGDSEVLTFFLFLMSAPYAFAASDADSPVGKASGMARGIQS